MLHRLLILISVMFAGIQTVALAHAVEHGDHHHEHDGIVCELATFADRNDEDFIVPEFKIDILPHQLQQVRQFEADALIVPTINSHQPGRGPPLS